MTNPKTSSSLLTDAAYLEIINALHYGVQTVSDLAQMLKQPLITISDRLAKLQKEKLVVVQSKKPEATYRLVDDVQLASLSAILYELWSEALAQPQTVKALSL